MHGPTANRGRPTRRSRTTQLLRRDPLTTRPRRVLLVLPRGLAHAVQVRGTEHRASTRAGSAVERLPRATAAHQQAAGDQVVTAGEEDTLNTALRLLQAWSGARAGHDDAVAGRDADDELTGNGALEARPEIAGEQQA